MKKTTWITLSIIALLVIGGSLAYVYQSQQNNEQTINDSSVSDAEKFRLEYPQAAVDNRYVYASSEQVISTLEEGSGIVYLGFPECPWCQSLVPMIDEAAAAEGIDEVYYLDIREMREDGSSNYDALVAYLKEYLETDENGQPRIFVPDVTAVKDGEVMGRFMQEAGGPDERTPDTYWNDERKESAVTQLREMMAATKDS